MSAVKTQELVSRMAKDADFRNSVISAPTREDKKAILESAGYGDVTQDELQSFGPSAATELSDAELEAVAGGRVVEWVSAVSTVVAAASAVVAGAAATVAAVAAAL
jgi:predicted ribosomally synthesized peptide with nif11-like leader